MRWILVPLLVLHGLIHLLGFSLACGGTATGMTGGTLVPLGDFELRVAGVAWQSACLALLVAALGVALGQDWWRPVALVAALMSQALVILWWPDARAGTLANILIVAAVVWRPGLAAWRAAQRANARVRAGRFERW